MKVLFVCSGNSSFGIAPFTKVQGDSLISKDIQLDYYPLKGKGLWGYLKNINPLSRKLKSNNYDIIHAHYSLCGWVALLAKGKEKLIVSLMGDDAYGTFNDKGRLKISSIPLIVATKLLQPFCDSIIVKSQNIHNTVKLKKRIPNRVNLDLFNEILNEENNENSFSKIKVLFLGDTNDKRKNIKLLLDALKILNDNRIELINPFPIKHNQVIRYLQLADIFVLTSIIEGSPNVIKEAMACNCPIVTTNVGDVNWVVGDTKGCYISSFEPEDFADKLKIAISFVVSERRTMGRQRIIDLELDSESVANRIIEVYKNVLY